MLALVAKIDYNIIMIFILLVAFSALFVAGCAAFFSIKGLITLFAGSALAIGIMASSLEIGKLVAASFLHSYWKDIKFSLKLYLCTAVFVLMCITSLGIFGFLTNAYQVHASAVGSFETKIETLASEKNTIEQSISESASRIKTLVDVRVTQEQRVKDSGNYKAPREQAYKAISEANEEIQAKEAQVVKDRERLVEVDKEISELKIGMNTTTDIGSFKFIASALGTTVDRSVQYFILALIFVFDPLAVALVLAWNKLLDERNKKKLAAEQEYRKELEKLTEPLAANVDYNPQKELSAIRDIQTRESSDKSDVTAPRVKKKLIREYLDKPEAKETPVDLVSNVPIADIEDLEKDPRFLALTEEEQTLEKAKRKSSGKNNSVITRG